MALWTTEVTLRHNLSGYTMEAVGMLWRLRLSARKVAAAWRGTQKAEAINAL